MLAQVLTGEAPAFAAAPRMAFAQAGPARPGGAARLALAAMESWPASLVVLLPLLLSPAAGSPRDLGRLALLLVALALLGQAGASVGRPGGAGSPGRIAKALAASAMLGGAGCLLAQALHAALLPVALALLAVEITFRLGRRRPAPLVAAVAGAGAALRLEAAALLLDVPHGPGLVLLAFLLGCLVTLAQRRRERLLGPGEAAPGPGGGTLPDLALGIAAAGAVGVYLAVLAAAPAIVAAGGPLAYASVPLALGALLRWWRIAVGPGPTRPSGCWLRDRGLALLLGLWGVSLGLALHLLPALRPAPGMLHLVAPIW